MECFRLHLDHLAWIKHQFLSGIRDSRKAGSLWEMMRCVGGVRKSIHQSWLAKELGLQLLCWGFKGVQEEIPSERPALIKSGQWHFHHDNAPVHNSILVIDYLTKIGNKTVPHPTYSPGLAPCDFCLFSKLTGCCYETKWGDESGCDECHWHPHTRGHPWGLSEVVGSVEQMHCSPRRLLRRGTRVSCVCYP